MILCWSASALERRLSQERFVCDLDHFDLGSRIRPSIPDQQAAFCKPIDEGQRPGRKIVTFCHASDELPRVVDLHQMRYEGLPPQHQLIVLVLR